jgi:hypothetical protein
MGRRTLVTATDEINWLANNMLYSDIGNAGGFQKEIINGCVYF